MNHVEAEASGAVERYLLGEMTDPEQAGFEEHFFCCPRCAEEIRMSTIFVSNLRAVLREPYAVSRRTGAGRVLEMPTRNWKGTAAIAAALLCAIGLGYQSLVVIPRLRHEVIVANRADSPPTFYLSESRAAGDVLAVPPGTRHISLMFNQVPGRTYPYYDCELRDEVGRAVRDFRVAAPAGVEEWQLRLPVSGLTGQPYTLKVRGASTATGAVLQDVAEYHFRLDFR